MNSTTVEKDNIELEFTGEEDPSVRVEGEALTSRETLLEQAEISRPGITPPCERNGFITGSHTLRFIRNHYPEISLDDWNDWRWQLRHSITTLDGLRRLVLLREDEIHTLSAERDGLPFRITPYHASILNPGDINDPMRRIMIPDAREFDSFPEESADPLNEEEMSPVTGIVHRYPDRVLFLTTDFCASNCRYCTRSRMVGRDEETFTSDTWETGYRYIEEHKEIRDVLISGGDPLTLPDEALDSILTRIRAIPHVEIIRIGTRVPVVLPQRITPELMQVLRKAHPLWMNIHFTHPRELTPETGQALVRLADTGIPLGSQTVLLKGINDDAAIMRELMLGLVKHRVRPYYLYQCDPIIGSRHFRTPVNKGLEIIDSLRGHCSGLAVPQYVIDAPGGGGKIPLQPDYFIGKSGGNVRLRNYRGGMYSYPDPDGGEP